ncbi:MAG: trigger factor [Candidatus Scalindua sp. AMX11]|nr:MAG: trigger factor [Candidatus Scalindua sp.]NOG82340.1 trigger factor [Planctomycetota bacterium]RZV66907.1 MAG: trigger factor [Candidatus Scalindua sp. SCAELEC01]TDE63277.1 MAG: trigger factor [Candidatus Scalindua sp. AMX11]GJQ60545.1 MAG: trigger factor [Candidatus Scalindua sp.]
MKIGIEEIAPCKKLIKVEIPSETIEQEWQSQLNRLSGMVNLPGFRKGKAPKKLIEKKYSDRIAEDVKQSVISNTYQEAIKENGLSPVGEPELSDINLELGKPLIFDITLEVLPAFELGEYKGIKLLRKPVTVTNEDIEKTLKNINKQKTQLIVMEDSEIEANDHIICDCKVKVNKKIVWKGEDTEIEVSGSRVADIDVPDLQANLLGLQSGKHCSLKVELSDTFSVEEFRNSPATLELSVKEIKRPVAPEINDQMAKELDYESLDDLKEYLSKKLESEKKHYADIDMREQINKHLLEMADFELPKDMVKEQTNRKLHNYQIDLLNKGVSMEKIQENLKELKDVSEDSVVREFKLSLVLEQIAENERIYVTEKDLNNKIATLAHMYGIDQSKMRKQIEKMNSISNLRHELRETKTVDFLLKQAVVEDTQQENNT